VSADGRLADVVRTRIAPFLLPKVLHFESAREFMFRTVSQIMINYRGGPLSEGSAGHVHGGDRMPWAKVGSTDNHVPLASPTWQVHVYGAAGQELSRWCQSHAMALHRFDWSPEHDKAGFAKDATYLVRPDTYVALADTSGSPAAIERYFSQRQLRA
jgi:hypothetical protein